MYPNRDFWFANTNTIWQPWRLYVRTTLHVTAHVSILRTSFESGRLLFN
jgi:hypothetical protein